MTATPARGINTLFDRFMDGFEGSGIAANSDGTIQLYSAERLPLANWVVMASLPADVAIVRVKTMQEYLYVVTATLTLLAFFLIRWMTWHMLTRLDAVGKAMHRMTEGRVPMTALPVVRDDEIGQLIGNFNLLVEDRQRYETALRENEQRLAKLVESAPDAIFIQTKGCFAYLYKAAHKLFGINESKQLA